MDIRNITPIKLWFVCFSNTNETRFVRPVNTCFALNRRRCTTRIGWSDSRVLTAQRRSQNPSITSTRRPFRRPTNRYRFQFVPQRGCKQKPRVLSADYTVHAYVYNNPDFSPLENKTEKIEIPFGLTLVPTYTRTCVQFPSYFNLVEFASPPPGGTAHASGLIICSWKLL